MFTFKNIDINDVMRRLDGNEGLFKVLIEKFYGNYNKSYEVIEDLLIKDREKEAYELLHTIKGVSGNLGMKKLYENSGLLCEIIKNGQYNNNKVYFENFKMEFIKVIEEIKEFIK